MTREPLAIRAAIIAALTAAIDLAVAFGVPLSEGQRGAVLTIINALAALVIVLWVRPAVTPVADPQLPGVGIADDEEY